MSYIKKLGEIEDHDTGLVGGKGAALGRMFQAGFEVPDGFVILATAYEEFLAISGLQVEIEAILKTVDTNVVHTIDDASEKISSLIRAAVIPEKIQVEITNAFDQLGGDRVAVRSSATVEDGASAAWAGQLESYMNVSRGNLLASIQKCWASLFSPRAIQYGLMQKNDEPIAVAVVIQKMIQSEQSGVAFSVHPVTQDLDQLIIEASFGLGEAVVSGQVTPDSYVVGKQSRQIIDKNVCEQTKGLFVSEKDGNQWREIPKNQAREPVLTDEQIQNLADTVIEIENYFDYPCDIEWAIEKGEIFVLQSRPITTL